ETSSFAIAASVVNIADERFAQLLDRACFLVADGLRRDAPLRGDFRRRFALERGLDQIGLATIQRSVDSLLGRASPVRARSVVAGFGRNVVLLFVKRLERLFALSAFLHHVDRAEKVRSFGGFLTEDVANALVADIFHQSVEAIPAELLKQRCVNGLSAVVE